MKRDWDLLRRQLSDIEEERSVLADISDKSKWPNEVEREKEKARQIGHLELLVEEGLIEGIHIGREINRHYICQEICPRLTMSGHELLNTLRSPKLWEKIKSLAKTSGVELTFSVIKHFAAKAIDAVTS